MQKEKGDGGWAIIFFFKKRKNERGKLEGRQEKTEARGRTGRPKNS